MAYVSGVYGRCLMNRMTDWFFLFSVNSCMNYCRTWFICVIVSKTIYLYSFPNMRCTLLGLLQETQDVHFVLKETLGWTDTLCYRWCGAWHRDPKNTKRRIPVWCAAPRVFLLTCCTHAMWLRLCSHMCAWYQSPRKRSMLHSWSSRGPALYWLPWGKTGR